MGRRGRWRDVAAPAVALGILGFLALGFGNPEPRRTGGGARLRLACFPNLTHAPALAGIARGEFQRAVGNGVTVEPLAFNAGPEEMEALLAGEVDLGYVGPSPAINTYLKSRGRALRILAGASSGGAALLARRDVPLDGIRDLAGRRVAVPQIGGTQDVSLHYFLARNGLRSREKGGDVEVMPVKNADVLPLFARRQLEAAWVPEPWATRLQQEAGARRVLDERDLWPGGRFTTTVLVGRTTFLAQHPEKVEAVLRAHVATIEWLRAHPAEGQQVVNRELKRLTGKPLPEAILREAWERVEFTADPNRPNIEVFAQAARDAGYLPDVGTDVAGLFDPQPLGTVVSGQWPVVSSGLKTAGGQR